MHRTLILASASPQRRKLLRSLGVPFRVCPARISETCADAQPSRVAAELALRKARAVAARHPRSIVLGADTIVVCRGSVLVKPVSRADNARMLDSLNGRWHRVVTGVALVDASSGRVWREVVVSRVKARRLKPEELALFVGKHMDKAGGYAVQDRKDPFIERVVGPFDNVVGLPLSAVRRLLRAACHRRA
ncbi:MAG: nucleoside triphosphate pyrophosphatase [Elusimicrobiota bacterium]